MQTPTHHIYDSGPSAIAASTSTSTRDSDRDRALPIHRFRRQGGKPRVRVFDAHHSGPALWARISDLSQLPVQCTSGCSSGLDHSPARPSQPSRAVTAALYSPSRRAHRPSSRRAHRGTLGALESRSARAAATDPRRSHTSQQAPKRPLRAVFILYRFHHCKPAHTRPPSTAPHATTGGIVGDSCPIRPASPTPFSDYLDLHRLIISLLLFLF